jgi:hypothetical protein
MNSRWSLQDRCAPLRTCMVRFLVLQGAVDITTGTPDLWKVFSRPRAGWGSSVSPGWTSRSPLFRMFLTSTSHRDSWNHFECKRMNSPSLSFSIRALLVTRYPSPSGASDLLGADVGAGAGTGTPMGIVGRDRVASSSKIVESTLIGGGFLGAEDSRPSILATVSRAICFTLSGIKIPRLGLWRG